MAIHACRVLQTNEKVVFITPWQVGQATVEYAKQDGYRPVIVPEDIARALGGLTDLEGSPMFDLGAFQKQWNDSFTFTFVEPADLSESERAIYELTDAACKLAGVKPSKFGVKSVKSPRPCGLGKKAAKCWASPSQRRGGLLSVATNWPPQGTSARRCYTNWNTPCRDMAMALWPSRKHSPSASDS